VSSSDDNIKPTHDRIFLYTFDHVTTRYHDDAVPNERHRSQTIKESFRFGAPKWYAFFISEWAVDNLRWRPV